MHQSIDDAIDGEEFGERRNPKEPEEEEAIRHSITGSEEKGREKHIEAIHCIRVVDS